MNVDWSGLLVKAAWAGIYGALAELAASNFTVDVATIQYAVIVAGVRGVLAGVSSVYDSLKNKDFVTASAPSGVREYM